MFRKKPILYITLGLSLYLLLVTLIVIAEKDNEAGSIHSFSDGLWYSVVTLTTVGYGDKFPVTDGGKVVGLLFLLGSLGFLGILVGKINENIQEHRERKKMGLEGTEMKRHVVIIGWNNFAQSITRQLFAADREVAIITDQREDIDLIYAAFPGRPIFVLFSDLKNVPLFTKVNIQKSDVIFINAGTDTDKLIAILNLKKVYTDLRYVVTLDNSDLKDTFQSAGVTYALSKNEIASKMIASYIFEPDVAEFSNDLISATEVAGEYDIQQYVVLRSNPYISQSYGEAFWDLKQNYDVLLIGLSKVTSEGRTLLKLPPDNTPIAVGDYLIVITDGVGEKKLIALFGTREGIVG